MQNGKKKRAAESVTQLCFQLLLLTNSKWPDFVSGNAPLLSSVSMQQIVSLKIDDYF
jgi:hypothetical protein